MAQVTIYIDDETAREIDEAATSRGLSRSAWFAEAAKHELRGTRRLPKEWFDSLGGWVDDRTTEEILADIDAYGPDRELPSFDD